MEAVRSFYENYCYYIILALFLCWTASLCRVIWCEKAGVLARLKEGRAGLLIALAICVLIVISVESKVRVMNDEPKNISQSQMMFLKRKIALLEQGRFDHGIVRIDEISTPKRPPLYPFFVHLAHTFTGYRAANAYAVSLVSLFVVLSLMYLLALRRYGPYCAAAMMFLTVSHQIVTTNAVAASYDMFFLCFGVVCLCALLCFLKKPNSQSLLFLILSLVMLAYIRLEAAFYSAVFIGILLVAGRLKARYFKPWIAYFMMPLFFIPLICHKLLVLTKATKINYVKTTTESFAGEHVSSGALRTLKIYFSFDGYYPLAPLVCILGMIAVIFFLARRLHRVVKGKTPFSVPETIILICVSAYCSAILFFKYGRPDGSPTARYYVLIYTCLSIAAAVFLHKICSRYGKKTLPAILALAAFLFYHPDAVADKFVAHQGGWIRRYGMVMDYLKPYQGKNVLLICYKPALYMIHNFSAVKIKAVNRNPGEIKRQLQQNKYEKILLIQEIRRENKKPMRRSRFTDRLDTRIVYEKPRDANMDVRISEIVGPA